MSKDIPYWVQDAARAVLQSPRHWDDDSEEPDEWPYPDSYTESTLPDSMVWPVSQKLNVIPGGHTFTLREREVSGGYSEFTQENYYDFAVLMDGEVIYESPSDDVWDNGLVQFLKWLDSDS